MFDPNKHRKTAARLATIATDKKNDWQIQKPKNSDFIQIFGNSIKDLAEVNMYEQRDGGGQVKEWLIQGDTDAIDEEIVSLLNPKAIKSAIVCPCVISATGDKFIWLAKQIRNTSPLAQKGWVKIYWDESTRTYVSESPRDAAILGNPVWPTADEILEELKKSFKERIIDSTDHEIVKRTIGLIK